MNEEKQIAQAIMDAQKMHEESYVSTWEQTDQPDSLRTEFGEYTKDWEECFITACKVNCLSPNMWFLLSLANHWLNDIQLWAEDVLAGRYVYDVLTKDVNASPHLGNETDSDGNLLDSHRK